MSDDDAFIDNDDLDPSPPSEQAAQDDADKFEKAQRAFLLARAASYKRVFAGNASQTDVTAVIDDLRRFCRGDQSAWNADARTHALITGRQEVWLRVTDHVRLSEDGLVERYIKPSTRS